MRKIPSVLEPSLQAAEAERLGYSVDSTGVRMARNQSVLIYWPEMPHQLGKAVREIERSTGKVARYWMVNVLPAGVSVPLHTDTLRANVDAGRFVIERWHLPIVTDRESMYWDPTLEDMGYSSSGRQGLHMEPRFWYGPIPYWLDHCIWNDGTLDRTHLIVDLE